MLLSLDCIQMLQKMSAKREIRTSLPLGNITMCIFSPRCLSVLVQDQHRPPLTPSPPCPPQTSFDGRACTDQAALSPQPPEAALLLFCAFLHFQSVGWGGGSTNEKPARLCRPIRGRPGLTSILCRPMGFREATMTGGSRQARTAVVTHGIRRCGVIR